MKSLDIILHANIVLEKVDDYSPTFSMIKLAQLSDSVKFKATY